MIDGFWRSRLEGSNFLRAMRIKKRKAAPTLGKYPAVNNYERFMSIPLLPPLPSSSHRSVDIYLIGIFLYTYIESRIWLVLSCNFNCKCSYFVFCNDPVAFFAQKNMHIPSRYKYKLA